MERPIAILMDVDQVLLDYVARLRDFARDSYGIQLSGMATDWDMSGWMGIPKYRVLSILKEFHSDWRFGCMDMFPGADVILTRLKNMGYHLIFVTACGSDPITVALRRANLHACFREIFTEGHFVGLGASKAEVLQDLAERYDIHLFVDDRPENLDDALSVGINNVVLMKAPHNRSVRHKYDTAFAWYDIMMKIEASAQG